MTSNKKKTKKKQVNKNKNPFMKRSSLLFSKWTMGLIVAVAVSLAAFVGTFAWFTSSDQIANAFEGTHLVAEIDETFSPKVDWQPGEDTTKEVRVKNTGDSPAIVRLSLYEFLLNFQIDVTDQTGNANLKTVDQSVSPEVDGKNTDTWYLAAKGKGTYKNNSTYYVANQAWVSDPTKQTGMYEYEGALQNEAPFKYITLNFTGNLKTTVDAPATNDYWLYDSGYFYYSRVLKPGEITDDLLKSVTLSESIPNQYKGALYKLKVYMDAHDVTSPVLSAWSLSKGSPAYALVESQIK